MREIQGFIELGAASNRFQVTPRVHYHDGRQQLRFRAEQFLGQLNIHLSAVVATKMDAKRYLTQCMETGEIARPSAPILGSDIRDVLTANSQSRALRLHAAQVLGGLDLSARTVPIPVSFTECVFWGDGLSIDVTSATLRSMTFSGCRIQSGIAASGVHIEDALKLDNCHIYGGLNLEYARVDGVFSVDGCHFTNPFAEAVNICGARFRLNVLLQNCGIVGLVDASYAEVLGTVDLSQSVFRKPFGDALSLQGIRIGGDLHIESITVEGCLRMIAARVEGVVNGNRATLKNECADALVADRITVKESVFFDRVTVVGEVRLIEANIVGQFTADGGAFNNQYGTAISADYAKFGGSWIVEEATIDGNIRLCGTSVDGQLSFHGTRITSPGVDALQADRLRVGGTLYLSSARLDGTADLTAACMDALNAEALHISGPHVAISGDSMTVVREVNLRQAQVTGLLSIRDATLGKLQFGDAQVKALGIVAVDVAGATIRGALSMGRQFKAVGAVVADHVNARSLDLQGDIQCCPSQAAWCDVTWRDDYAALPDGVAFSAAEARVGRLSLPSTAIGGVINLTRASVGTLVDLASGWPRGLSDGCATGSHLVLDGFSFDYLENPNGAPPNAVGGTAAEMRLKWLRGQHKEDLVNDFKPQPWRHLATVLRRQGYDDDARSIDVAQRVFKRQSKGTTAFQRFVSWFLHKVSDYGLSPWKALCASAVFVGVFALSFWLLLFECEANGCATGAPFVRRALLIEVNVHSGTSTESFNSFAYSLDRFLPVSLGIDDMWRPNPQFAVIVQLPGATAPTSFEFGWLVLLLSISEQILGGLLVALTVIGFTGLLTRDRA